MYIVEIDIGNGKTASVGQCVAIFSGCTVGYFSYSTGHIVAAVMVGSIVSAGDGNDHGLFNGAAVVIVDGDGVGLGQGLACGQIVNVAIRNGKFPIDLPGAVTGGVIADGGCKGAPIVSGGGFKGDGLFIGEIYIAMVKLPVSVNVLLFSPVAPSAISVTAPVTSVVAAMVGASLVPVMVMVTGCSPVPPLSSSTVTV